MCCLAVLPLCIIFLKVHAGGLIVPLGLLPRPAMLFPPPMTRANSRNKGPMKFLSPMPSFPSAGITPPHPHPVAPFPPPPRSYASLQHSPVQPAPLSLKTGVQQEPLYSLAKMNRPPNTHPPQPLPHTLPTSPYPHSQFAARSPLTPTTVTAISLPVSTPSQPSSTAVAIPFTCTHCGHYNIMLADISGGGTADHHESTPTTCTIARPCDQLLFGFLEATATRTASPDTNTCPSSSSLPTTTSPATTLPATTSSTTSSSSLFHSSASETQR